MVRWVGVCVAVMMAVTSVEAAPRRSLVLPLEGNAEPSLRTKLNLTVQKLARQAPDTKVTNGDTTFSETAAAVGCDPAAPECAETVRSTLGVDEVVWGTATWDNGKTNLVVYRATAKKPVRSSAVLLATQDTPEKAETALAPVFDDNAPLVTDPVITDPVVTDPVVVVPPPVVVPGYNNRKRNTGIIFATAGGVVLIIGLALWSNASSVQQDIDDSTPEEPDDFATLEGLESRAFKYAMAGNLMVASGLALGGYGAWVLYQDRKERRVVVTPQVTPTAATITVGGSW